MASGSRCAAARETRIRRAKRAKKIRAIQASALLDITDRSLAWRARRSSAVNEHRREDQATLRGWAMTGSQAGFERRVQSALEASPSRIPVVVGGCGTGRTFLLRRLCERAARGTAQYVDVERCATTPERFFAAVTAASPFAPSEGRHAPSNTREAFDALRAFVETSRAPGAEPCTFLLDEVLELRTFESFPGLRHVLRDLLE